MIVKCCVCNKETDTFITHHDGFATCTSKECIDTHVAVMTSWYEFVYGEDND